MKSYATIKKTNVAKTRTETIKKLDKKITKLEKSQNKQFLINIIIATVFFVLGLAFPIIISYFN